MGLDGSNEGVRASLVGGEKALIHCNRQRDKTFSQMMREAEKLDEIERKPAKRRMVAAHAARETLPEQEQGRVRDKVAEAIGIGSRKQYEKATSMAGADPQLVQNFAQAEAFTYRYRTLTTK